MLDEFKNSIVRLEKGASSDFSSLINEIGDAKIVLLGEATHGTHEFYKTRAEISKKLIAEKGFTAILVEADWPNAYQVNKFVQGFNSKVSEEESLKQFKRFPVWMWRNKDILEFVRWLFEYNQKINLEDRIGFYGLDLYSLNESAKEVIEYLNKVDTAQVEIAKQRYACFEKFGNDVEKYGYLVSNKIAMGCEKEIIDQVKDLLSKKFQYLKQDGYIAQEEYFCAKQNSLLVKNAEEYYRKVFSGSYNDSWNFRDIYMMKTLISLYEHQKSLGKDSKIIVWAHNSHIGDARFTEFSKLGQINLGQLVREMFNKESFLVGFTTYEGTVSAASDWGSEPERKIVRPAIPGSFEHAFHEMNVGDFLILLKKNEKQLIEQKLERAIGVIYLPRSERVSHYFFADMQKQFDAVIHFDKTKAVEPLEKTATWQKGELPETYPFGI